MVLGRVAANIGFLGVAISLATSPVTAQPTQIETGNDLLAMCTNETGNSPWALCAGYIAGTIATAELAANADPVFRVCLPAGVNNGQIRDIVVAYLRNHPEDRHRGAPALILVALNQALCDT